LRKSLSRVNRQQYLVTTRLHFAFSILLGRKMNSNFSLDHISNDDAFPQPVNHHFSESTNLLSETPSRIELIKKNSSSKIFDTLWSTIEETAPSILSFDVFDTVLLRNNKSEAQRYLELSEVILDHLKNDPTYSKQVKGLNSYDFYLSRCQGMSLAYRTSPAIQGCREGRIEDVIKAQRTILDLDKSVEKIFLEKEIAYEAENLTLNSILIDLIDKFKQSKEPSNTDPQSSGTNLEGKVIFVSDMYLSSTIIAEIISKLTDKKIFDFLFSSADLTLSKRSGKIFKKIENELGSCKETFLHFGDALIGDVQKPREAGWSSVYFPVSLEEKAHRQTNLEKFISTMDEAGLQTRRWAKI